MRLPILAGAAALIAAAPSPVSTPAFRCYGYAEEPGAERAVAVATIDQTGLRQSLSVGWAPVQTIRSAGRQGEAPGLELWVHYPAYSPEHLNVATSATLTLTTLVPPAARGSSTRHYRDLARWRIEVSFDGGEPIAVSQDNDNTASDLPMTASRTALLAIPATAKIALITLRDARGRIVKTSSFDLATGKRDVLLPAAIAAAANASGDHRTCERTD